MSDEDDPLLDVLGNAVLSAEDMVWRTNAMAKLPVRFPDGKYKNTALSAGDPELLFTGVRAGKRADYIFEFEPVDDRPYKTVEMDETKVFNLLQGFEELIVRTIAKAIGDDNVGMSFGQARARYKTAMKKRAAKVEQERVAAAVVTDADRYRDNPLWGAF